MKEVSQVGVLIERGLAGWKVPKGGEVAGDFLGEG